MKVGAFFFDLDGTLVDTEAVWAGAIVDWLAESGAKADEGEILKFIVGRSWRAINEALHERYPELGASHIEEDSRRLRAFYAKRVSDSTSLVIRDSVEFFKRVSAIAPCGIVSGSPHADIVNAAKLCGIDDRLQLVLGVEDYSNGKPDPSPYLTAAAKLGVAPEECVVVEDSVVGVTSGVAAGMKVIAIKRESAEIPGVWMAVESLSEIDVAEVFK